MVLSGSIFLDFHLPNATTWFYMSLVLVVVIFFRFDRFLCLRNWDLLTLFLVTPALLLLHEARQQKSVAAYSHITGQVGVACGISSNLTAGPAATYTALVEVSGLCSAPRPTLFKEADSAVWRAYLWVALGSVYFLLRSLLDLGVVRRPVLSPNLNAGGLILLGVILLAVLGYRTVMLTEEAVSEPSPANVILDKAATVAAQAAEEVNRTVSTQHNPHLAAWIRSALALAGHLVVVFGLAAIGARHFQSIIGGVAAAVLFLLLPYTAYHIGEIYHIFPAALVLGAILAYRRPTCAGILLGLAAGTVYFPVLLFPLWFSFYWRRGAGRFAVAFCGVMAIIGLSLLLDGSLNVYLESILSRPDWRAWDFSAQPKGVGLWTGIELHYAYRVPFFIAYVALVLTTAFWPARKHFGHLIALTAALIIGVQFWYANAGGTYVLWYLPLLVLLTLRPTLTDRFAPEIDPAKDWLARSRRWVFHQVERFLRAEPVPAGR
jgi:hypothetical protein